MQRNNSSNSRAGKSTANRIRTRRRVVGEGRQCQHQTEDKGKNQSHALNCRSVADSFFIPRLPSGAGFLTAKHRDVNKKINHRLMFEVRATCPRIGWSSTEAAMTSIFKVGRPEWLGALAPVPSRMAAAPGVAGG